MKILKERGKYLEQKARKALNNTLLFFFFAGAMFYLMIVFHPILFLPSIFFSGLGFLRLKYYWNYEKGIRGEEKIVKALKKLDDRYYPLNDIKTQIGNIDHVVLGPNGIFVIETKNWSTGAAVCEGDGWFKEYIGHKYKVNSPSSQAKFNAKKMREVIESSQFISRGVWVNSIAVFTNSDLDIRVHQPTLPVLTLKKLCSYIKNKPTHNETSKGRLLDIGKVVLTKNLMLSG